jgi:hypothetical protein
VIKAYGMINPRKAVPIVAGSEARGADRDIQTRKHNAERTKQEILAAAIREFAAHRARQRHDETVGLPSD